MSVRRIRQATLRLLKVLDGLPGADETQTQFGRIGEITPATDDRAAMSRYAGAREFRSRLSLG